MAEAFSLKILSQAIGSIAFPALKAAHKKGKSIAQARQALHKLRATIQTLQARLVDAAKNQQHNQPESESVKNWIKRLKDVLYDAEDLFDQVYTDDRLKKQGKVSSFLYPIVSTLSNFSIAPEVTGIRSRLQEISKDMSDFLMLPPGGTMRRNEDELLLASSDVDSDSNYVVGRVEDKKSIKKMILNDSTANKLVPIIAIVGIGGMGKTTLAQLIFNDQEIGRKFDKMGFACISNTRDNKELIGKIFESISTSGESYKDLNVTKLSMEIGKLIAKKKFLLVLDAVWEGDCRWLENQMSLLSLGAKGSKIIVTTRSLSIPRIMDVDDAEIHHLNGLSDDESWDLFKKIAFDNDQMRDPTWIDLGERIVTKCANVPLAIKCIARHLRVQDSIGDWQSFIEAGLSKESKLSSQLNILMSVLKLSYDQLESTPKQCFAYCSLFPKSYVISKQELIYLWIAQGYINCQNNSKKTVEEMGHSVYMDLLRVSLLQKETKDLATRDVLTCKMHHLIHDLAQLVAEEDGDESIVLTTSSDRIECSRHVSVAYSIDDSWVIPTEELHAKRLRSFLFMGGGSVRSLDLLQVFAKHKFLRVLSLKRLQIDNVPESIGELKLLRYLDLSETTLTSLPKSITKLLNLQNLDVHKCKNLKALPSKFRNLVNLRRLDIRDCDDLKYMPPEFEKLSSLQQLDEFKVGIGGHGSGLKALIKMKLRGKLKIRFEDNKNDWSGVESWKPPLTLQQLSVVGYRGTRILNWVNGGEVNLTHLSLFDCSVTCLPSFKHLPKLTYLYICKMEKLEYIEGNQSLTECPNLTNILLINLPKLKAWSRRIDAVATKSTDVSSIAPPRLFTFSSLSTLHVDGCPELASLALFPKLRDLSLKSVKARVISQLLSEHDSSSLSSSLKHVSIESCDGLTSFPGKSLKSLQYLFIRSCNELESLELAPLGDNIIEVLCLSELELWNQMGVDWDSFPKLRLLSLYECSILPNCLQLRRDNKDKLKIEVWNENLLNSFLEELTTNPWPGYSIFPYSASVA